MITPDLINSSFEFLAGFFVLNHCRHVLRDKAVAGVSLLSVVFFACWGCWNLFYYPHLNQWFSFFGGIFITFTNATYVAMLFIYRRKD